METSKMSEWDLLGDYGVLTLNNPPQNYLKEPEFVDLSDLKQWISNESLRGVIITGKGRHFCAGGDRENIFDARGEQGTQESVTKGKELFNYIWDLPIPTVLELWNKCRVELRRRHDSQFATVQSVSKSKLSREKW